MSENYNEKQDERSCFWKWVNIYRFDNQLYLKRLIVLRCPLFSIMLHKIYLDDTDCQHSHPWNFTTFLLKGGYYEYTPKGMKRYKALCVLYRPAKWIHRLEVSPYKPPTITLVITGKKIQSWGFFTKLGFVNWRDYKASGSCE